jgi:DNA-binding transcriptional ArsR family regulator
MQGDVYIDRSVIDMKPQLMQFFKTVVDAVENLADGVVAVTKKELALQLGKTEKTVSRYLKTLEEADVIEQKGIRGRGGKTVIRVNMDVVKFTTNENSDLVKDTPTTMDEVVEALRPKKKEDKKEKTRKRRTKKEMEKWRFLQNELDDKVQHINDEIESSCKADMWKALQHTDSPAQDYKTYILTRIYNRMAVISTDRANEMAEIKQDGKTVPSVSSSYDILPDRFYGTVVWNHFKKFEEHCKEIGVDPVLYLSAQFNHSVFLCSIGKSNKSNFLPYVNTLRTEKSAEVYERHFAYQKRFDFAYRSSGKVTPSYMDDSLLNALYHAYETAEEPAKGWFRYRGVIGDFLRGEINKSTGLQLRSYYESLSKDLQKRNISSKSKETIKKYVLVQSLIQLGGTRNIPMDTILAQDTTQLALFHIKSKAANVRLEENANKVFLGMMAYPMANPEWQKSQGDRLVQELKLSSATLNDLRMIADRRGLSIPIQDIREALKEYGTDKVPVTEFSMLDVPQIVDSEEFALPEEEPAPKQDPLDEPVEETADMSIDELSEAMERDMLGGE